MKFKKPLKYKFSHYTRPVNAIGIVNDGFRDRGQGHSENSRVYVFNRDNDQNSKNLNNWSQTAYQNYLYMKYKNKYPINDHKQSMKNRQMNVLRSNHGNEGGYEYDKPIVRVVGESTNKPRFISKRSNVTEPVREIGEKHLLPNEVDKSSLKVQIPFGAVNRSNYINYIEELKDLDPSKFDMNDTYTRRLYNLYKNGSKHESPNKSKLAQMIKDGKIDPSKIKNEHKRNYLENIAQYYDNINKNPNFNKEITYQPLRDQLARELLKDRKVSSGLIETDKDLAISRQKKLDEIFTDKGDEKNKKKIALYKAGKEPELVLNPRTFEWEEKL